MNSLIKRTLLWMVAVLFIAGWTGCRNDDYLVDGGISSPYYEGTVMDFLESRPDLFSDLVKVIKQTSWEKIFRDNNEEITFFAPTDFSLEKSVDFMNNYLYSYMGMDKIKDLSQVKPEVWDDLIGMYVMKGYYRLNDIVQIDTVALSAYPGQTNLTYNKENKMTMGVYYEDANGIRYAGYRRIMYAYPETGYPIYAYVATSNIEPTNGIVHVLRYDHPMGFTPLLLMNKALEAGILDPDPTKGSNERP